jgi:hypothetical protein
MRVVDRPSPGATSRSRFALSARGFAVTIALALVTTSASPPALAQTPPRQPLVPVGGLFGATGLEDAAYDVAFGPDGAAYVVGGGVQDPDVTFESYSDDAFVLALAPDGTTRWTHWLAGTRDYRLDPTCAELAEGGLACARWEPDSRGLGGADVALSVDVRGNRLVVAGHTYSADFPVDGPGQQTPFLPADPTRNSRRDGFVTVFDSLFGTVLTSTYVGGNDDDLVVDVAFTSDDTFIVIGQSRSDLTVDTSIAPPPAVNGPAPGWWQEFRRTDGVPETWVASPPVALQGTSDVQLVRSLPIGSERWVFGHDAARPLWWRFPEPGVPPTQEVMTVAGQAALVDVFEIGTNGAGEPMLAAVGVTTGAVGGFDGAACDAVVGTACGNGPCGTLSDVFVARLRGGHCERVTYLGGSFADVPFAASYSRYDATRNWLAVAGRTTSNDFPTRAAQQSEAAGPFGFGQEAFFSLLDLDTGQVRLSTYLGLRPPFLDGITSSDDVATGVALGPNREAVLVGSTWTGLGAFARALPFSRPFVVGDNGQAFVARLPLDVAELGVSADFTPEVADLSGSSTLTVYLTNEGTTDATNVTVVVVPTDIVLDPTGTGGLCRASGPALICGPPGDRIAEGASATISIPATAPATRGRYEVAVTAYANEYDPNTANNEVKATLIVGGVDLSVQIAPATGDAVVSDEAAVVAIDGAREVRVTVANLGGEAVDAQLTLTSTQPTRAPLEVTGLPSACASATGGRTPITCRFDGLRRGTPTELELTFELAPDPALGLRTLTEVRAGLVASVAVIGTTPDANPGNDRATALTSFRQPDLAFVSGTATPAAVGWGRPFSFRLEGRNTGPGDAHAVTGQLDTAFEHASLPAGCSRDATLITCTAPAGADPLAAGGSAVWTIPLVAPPRIDAEPPRTVRVETSVTHRYGELDLTNNTGGTDVAVGAVDVRVSAPTPAPNYRTGIAEPITWTVSNESDETANDVVLGLTISNAGGVELPVARADGGNCTLVSSATHIEATCPVGTLTPRSSSAVTLELRPGGRGTLTQAAVVTTTETNAAASRYPVVQTDTVRGPDLTGTLRLPSDGPVRGQRYAFDVDVANVGQGRSTLVSPNATYRVTGAFQALAHGLSSTDCSEEVVSSTPGTQTIRCKTLYEPSSGPSTATVLLTPTRVGSLTTRIDASDREDENSTNGSQERVVTVRGADLVASLSTPASVEVGESFEIEVPIRNAGPADAAEPRLSVTWDAATSLIVDGSTPAGCSEVGSGLECDLTLANGAETSVRVPLRAQRSGTATFRIRLQERGDPAASVLSGSATVRVTRPDVAVTATSLVPRATIAPSEPLDASFRLANQSTTTAAGPLRLRLWAERVPGSTG